MFLSCGFWFFFSFQKYINWKTNTTTMISRKIIKWQAERTNKSPTKRYRFINCLSAGPHLLGNWKTQNELIEDFKAYPIVYKPYKWSFFLLKKYYKYTLTLYNFFCFIPCSSCLKHLFKLLSFQFNFFFSFQFKRIFNNTRK